MYRIMIIEDDEAIRRELASLLKHALYEPASTETFTNLPQQIEKVVNDLIGTKRGMGYKL